MVDMDGRAEVGRTEPSEPGNKRTSVETVCAAHVTAVPLSSKSAGPTPIAPVGLFLGDRRRTSTANVLHVFATLCVFGLRPLKTLSLFAGWPER